MNIANMSEAELPNAGPSNTDPDFAIPWAEARPFLIAYRKLLREHGIEVSGCSCCDNPCLAYLEDGEIDESIHHLIAASVKECRREEPGEEMESDQTDSSVHRIPKPTFGVQTMSGGESVTTELSEG